MADFRRDLREPRRRVLFRQRTAEGTAADRNRCTLRAGPGSFAPLGQPDHPPPGAVDGTGRRSALDKEFERYERSEDGTITCHFADGTTATADVLVGADGANSRVCRQYLPHARRIDTGIRAIAGKLPLTDEVRRWLPHRMRDGPNNVLPPSGCGMFMAPHDLSDSLLPAAANSDEATLPRLHFNNTTSYLM